MKRTTGIIAALALALTPTAAIAAEAGGEEHGSWLLLLFFVINFGLFVLILVYYAMPMVRAFFAERAKSIRSELDRLGAALRDAEQLAGRARARAAVLEEDLRQLGEELEAETHFIVSRIRATTHATIERIKHDSELTATAAGEAAQRHVRARLAASAARQAGDLLARSFQPHDQGRLIDGFMEKLRQEAVR